MSRFAAAAAIIYTCASVSPAAAGERELVAAARAGDREALAAEARRMGAAGIARLLDAPQRETRQAALAAAGLAPDAWVLGPALVARLDDADRPAAAAAARALAEIAGALDGAAIEWNEAPVDEVAAIVDGCAAAARRGDLAPDVRVHALECASTAGTGLAGDLLSDPEPEVRRAAVYHAAGGDPAVRAALAGMVAGDAEVEVAATAGAALCRADTAAALAALSSEGRARLRAVSVDPLVEPGVVIGLIPCLRAGDADDRATLDRLAKKGPRVIRDHLRRK